MKDGALKILFLSNGIFVFASSLLGPLYAVYVQKLQVGTGVLTISFSWAVFLFSTTIFMFLVSKIGDGLPKDDMLIASFCFVFLSGLPIFIFTLFFF